MVLFKLKKSRVSKLKASPFTMLVIFACVSLIVLFVMNTRLYAQIDIQGLDNQPDLQNYIQKVVTKKYEAQDLDKVRPASIRSDILKAAKAKGFYNARVTQISSGNKNDTAHQFSIETGEVFTITSIKIEGLPYDQDLDIKQGDILNASAVMKEQARLFSSLSKDRCIYNLDVRNKAILDKQNNTAELIFIIEGQDDARFGPTTFEGADNIDRSYLTEFIRHKENECWNISTLENTKSALLSTGLLSTVDYQLPDKKPEDGSVPIAFQLKQRDSRTIRLGAKYSTSEGPGVIAKWTHRNILGSGETLSFESYIAQLRQSLGTEFTKPFLFSRKNSLKADAQIERQETEAYEELSFNTGAHLKRKLSNHWSGSLGIALEASEIKEENGTEDTFGLISYPASLSFDNRDNVLNPSSGLKLGLSTEPFYDTLGEADPFIKSKISAATYIGLGDNALDPILALRAVWGSIAGADTQNLPASKRFYAGGGGSIRGFGYQEAGPKDAGGDPTGGRSLLETSIEGRVKVTENIGTVAFVDAGGVFDSEYPDFDESLYVGAGVGLRYYTSFGPIRFDVAVPVNKREETDQNFQIYLSIGQAF